MQAKTRTNQGGSVINFLIVGVVLAAIALGAIYFANQRGKDAVDEPKAPIAVSPSGTASPSASPQAPTPSPNPPKPSTSPTPSTSPFPAPTGALPSTGPTDDLLMASLPLALIVMTTVAYAKSRRAVS